jgi:DNA/RNA endonuclease YhcR with UshA esterase domain
MTGRISIRLVKLTAIVLTTAGLAVLWWVARRAEVPTVPIDQIGATMNLAYVRVEGRCTRAPSYDPQTEYLSFWIADDTGELYVTSYRNETRVLVEEGRVPALGDKVAVAGTLRVRDDFRSLTVNLPQEVSITRPEPQTAPLGAIAPNQVYRRVRVRGLIRQVVEPYAGLTLITLRDETGTLDVALSDDLIAFSPVSPVFKVGQAVEVVATVSRYRGEVQLVPASLSDILFLDDEVLIAATCFIRELSPEDTGAWVALRGVVTAVHRFSKGFKLTLHDGTGAVTVLLWQDVYDDLKEELDSGREPLLDAEIKVRGELAEYRGELELIPELAADVRVLALSRSKDGETTPIGSVTAADTGQQLVLRGTLGLPDPFSVGIKFPLRDQTGTIILLLWDDVYHRVSDRDKLVLGAVVEVKGEIDQYRGELEIIPEADGVKVVEQ